MEIKTKVCPGCEEELPMRKFRNGKSFRKLCFKCNGRERRERTGTNLGSKARDVIIRARNRAGIIKVRFSIDALWLVLRWEKQKGRCYYTGRKMSLKPGDEVVSVDRRDSSKGYTPANCVLCCSHANMMKRSMKEMEFIAWCEEVVRCKGAKSRSRPNPRPEPNQGGAPGRGDRQDSQPGHDTGPEGSP
jgi:hypothetical protein